MSTTASLADALAQLASDAFDVGFAQSPGEAVFVRRVGPELRTHSGLVDLTWVYDVRLFSVDAELHWWWDQRARQGRYVCLDESIATARGWKPLLSHTQRLLRGAVTEPGPDDSGWSRLHDGHSRPLWIPFRAARSRRVALGAVEYVSADRRHGNRAVIAERLTGFEEVS